MAFGSQDKQMCKSPFRKKLCILTIAEYFNFMSMFGMSIFY